MIRLDLPFISEDVDRHGNVRVYFRRKGRKVRMRDPVGSAAFMARYEALRAATDAGAALPQEKPDGPQRPIPGSWRALCVLYFGSASYRRLAASTQVTRRAILESTFVEPIAPSAAHLFGDMPFARFGPKAVRILRDRKEGLPEAANGRVKAIRRVFRWAIEEEIAGVRANPARDIAMIRTGSTGFHTWSDDEVAQFEARWPVGSKPRLALALLLLTGARRSDVVKLGRQHSRDGWLRWTATKGARSNPVVIEIPVLPELAAIIAASPTGDLTYLQTEYGRAFTAGGFGGWFRERCNDAELPQCAAHGLRKAGSVRAANNGATAHQLMAMFGWQSLAQAELYTKAANRRRLAGSGMRLILDVKGATRA